MSSDFWLKKWQDNEIAFHQSKFHPELVKYGNRLNKGTLLVPLCGKSLDMIYLATLGHKVIGVELSPIACQDFFKEQDIPYTQKAFEGFIVFESDKITLWCGDFFKLPQKIWDQVTGLYDRAALIALPEEVRKQYATEIAKRGHKQLQVLLISLEYAPGAIEGPPFSVSEQEVRNLYAPFAIQLLHSAKEEKFSKNHPRLHAIELVESTYWLSR